MLQEREEWYIIDSSKTQHFMECPRKFFFRHILGWEQDTPNINLIYGSAWHLAMEQLYPKDRRPDYSNENLVKAYDRFLEYYRQYYPEMMDESNAPKSPSNTFRGLAQYGKMYKHDAFITLATEIAGNVMISDNKRIYFKVDTVVEDPKDGIYSLEHKTGRSPNRVWIDQWQQKMQIGVYTHVLYCLNYDPNKIFGMVVNGFFPSNPPRLKKDGTPRANEKDNQFIRLPIMKTKEKMQDWLMMANYWVGNIYHEIDRLSSCSADDQIMDCFPKNTENCTKWYGCPYMDYCQAWTNPLRKADSAPTGLVEEFWDPRAKFEEAEKVVEL